MHAHKESLLPENKSWKLIWNDEFDGKVLDDTKWMYRRGIMQKMHPGLCFDGAEPDGHSHLLLKLGKENNRFCSPQLQTGENFMDRAPLKSNDPFHWKFQWPIAELCIPKFMHRYGYYEIRCKFQTKPGWWSAFWLQSPINGALPNPGEAGVEVDIMENFTRDGNFSHNLHWNGYGKDYKGTGSGPRFHKKDPNGFHVYGVDWNKDGYLFYVDGVESWRFNEVVSHRDQFIYVSTECIGYRQTGKACGELVDSSVGDSFTVDYIRVFDEVK